MTAMTRSEFLAKRHANQGLPRLALVDLVARATGAGADVVDVQRIVRGDENEVHRVELAGGSTVYVRIREPGESGLGAEAEAMDLARRAGVPVPEVLTVEAIHDGRDAMVMAAASGRQLSELLPSLNDESRTAAMRDVGRVLAVLHTVPMPGLWRPNEAGVWPDPEELRRGSNARHQTPERRADLVAVGLTEGEADQAMDLFDTSPVPTHPLLCHGDVSPEHFFVDDDLHVTGVIDWGLWKGDSAVSDLADAAMRHEPRDLDAIVDGHGNVSREAIALDLVTRAVALIGWQLSVGDTASATPVADALRRALAVVVAE